MDLYVTHQTYAQKVNEVQLCYNILNSTVRQQRTPMKPEVPRGTSSLWCRPTRSYMSGR